RAEWEEAAEAARRKEAVTKALRFLNESLRQHAGDEPAERAAADEIERLLKVLRRRQEDRRKELERLQGLWAPKKMEFAGGAVLLEILGPSLKPPSAVAIIGDRFLTRAGTDPERVPTLRVYPGLKPAGIDFRVGGKVIRGVYELQGDTLRICIG